MPGMKCYRYIELNQIRAGMVEHPTDYKWSSYRPNAYGEQCGHLKSHSLYQGISAHPEERKADAHFPYSIFAKIMISY